MDNIPTDPQESEKGVVGGIASEATSPSSSLGPGHDALFRKSLAKELLADKTPQSETNDSERSLNPIVESSGSDHLSVSPSSFPRVVLERLACITG
jgi:hypothetical protein